MSLSPEIEALRDEVLGTVSCADWAERQGWQLRRTGGELVGPCPLCGGRDRFAINTVKNVWSCRVCGVGGDVIFLVQHVEHLAFVPALERLAGRSAAAAPDPEAAARAAEERAAAEARRAQEAAHYREKARTDAWNVWLKLRPFGAHAPEPLAAYFHRRGLEAVLPHLEGMPIRLAHDRAYWHERQVVGRAPAMVAAIRQPDGRFGGIHQTWLSARSPKGKAEFVDGKGEPLPAKKVLGLKKGCAIRLVSPPDAWRLVMGEGIETTLSALVAEMCPARSASGSALRDRGGDPGPTEPLEPRLDTMYWAGIDLGNMSGKALRVDGRLVHDQPDMDDDGCFVPPSDVEELVYICDGDEAEKHTVEKVTRGLRRAMRHRAAQREKDPSLPALRVFLVPPGPEGTDLNSMLMEEVGESASDAGETSEATGR